MKNTLKSCFSAGKYLFLSIAVQISLVNSLLAAEFTLLETAVTHTSALAGVSPFQAAAGVPVNWNTPENYLGGTAHFELEIMDKPSEGSIHYSVCIEQGNTTACADSYYAYLTGFHQWTQPISGWSGIDQIDWKYSLSVILKKRSWSPCG